MALQRFKLHSEYQPKGDQSQAIEKLAAGVKYGLPHQVLLGVTGSGKTFTIANVIEKVQKPTLVISHNKTLAAQLFQEFREFFPQNEIHYFVSYYDYYQPEAYIPQRDLYIEKEADINKEIEKLRHSATQALMTRRDVVVVASVSCIYGLGRPEDYAEQSMIITVPNRVPDRVEPLHLQGFNPLGRNSIMKNLIRLLYQRNDWDFKRGRFRVRGDTVEVFPPYGEQVLRLEFLGEDLEKIRWIEPASSKTLKNLEEVTLFPAKHFITPEERLKKAMVLIENELEEQIAKLKNQGKELEAHRLKQRTEYDLELMSELGFCPGIENYSRHLTDREEGEPPYTLLDYFSKGTPRGLNPLEGSTLSKSFLCVIDESHMTIPQIRGMYRGDAARKNTLIEFGFRLPSARDNRPLRFEEFLERVPQIIYTSATPGEWEINRAHKSGGEGKESDSLLRKESDSGEFAAGKEKPHNGVVEQLIRPTGLLDPKIEIRPTEGQIKDLVLEIAKRKQRGERVLVTTLTKRMAEDLADYLGNPDKIGSISPIRTHYLHSEIKTLERSDILADLRRGKYDVVVGINLLREGLDLPEVSLVAILDADKEGFLRSETSLIQTMGRAARHIRGKVILYADNITGSMERAIAEVGRRRETQKEYNEQHGITPQTIQKPVRERVVGKDDEKKSKRFKKFKEFKWQLLPPEELENQIWEWEREMRQAAEALDFERAVELRDMIREARKQL